MYSHTMCDTNKQANHIFETPLRFRQQITQYLQDHLVLSLVSKLSRHWSVQRNKTIFRLLWISAPEATGPFGWLSDVHAASHGLISCQRGASPAIRIYQHILSPGTSCPSPRSPQNNQPASWSPCHIYSNQPFIHKTAAEIGLLSLKINNLFPNPHGKFHSPNHWQLTDSLWRKCVPHVLIWMLSVLLNRSVLVKSIFTVSTKLQKVGKTGWLLG